MGTNTKELAGEVLRVMRRGRSFRRAVLMIGCVTSLGTVILIGGCGASRGVSDSVISTNKTASVISTNKTACAQYPTIIAQRKTRVAVDLTTVATVVIRSTPVFNGDEPAVRTATANRIANAVAGGLAEVARGATSVARSDATSFAEC
jgi:hypothetical protein